MRPTQLTMIIMALLFVFLYGSGFVAVKLGVPYAPALVFLSLRFIISAFILVVIAIIWRAPLPATWKEAGHITIAGLLLVCTFSIGTWISMYMGVPPAISALIIALQPLLVAVIATLILKERINLYQWIGFILGLIGIVLVVGEEYHYQHLSLLAILMSVLGLLGLTGGNLYQKKFCANMNVFTGGAIQLTTSAIICILLSFYKPSLNVIWSEKFTLALLWIVIASVGGLSLLYILLRHGEANKVASVFYLIPVVAAAVMAYFIFGSQLDHLQLLGMLITIIGVALVTIKFNKIKSIKSSITQSLDA